MAAVACMAVMLHAACSFADDAAKPAAPSGRVAALIAALGNPDPAIRQVAARNLGDDGDKTASPALMSALANDPDVSVRLVCLGALATINDSSALHAYENALGDVNEMVRQGAAEALSGKWQESAHKALVNALKSDPSAKVRRSIAQALGNPGIMGRYTGHGWEGAAISQAALITALKDDKDYGVRAVSATMLGKYKNRESLKPLLDALEKDANLSVRAAAAESLGLIEMPGVVKPLSDVVYFEKDEMLVVAALKGLKYAGDKAAADAAIEALRSRSAAVRWEAIDVLEEFRAEDAVEPLTELANDDYESEGVKHKAQLALQSMGKW